MLIKMIKEATWEWIFYTRFALISSGILEHDEVCGRLTQEQRI